MCEDDFPEPHMDSNANDKKDLFQPNTDNICDICWFMQFNLKDPKCPCRHCVYYFGVFYD
jgi:hypothetical protein